MSMQTIDADILFHKLIAESERCCERFAEDEPGEMAEHRVFRRWTIYKLANLLELLTDMVMQIADIKTDLLLRKARLDANALIEAMTEIAESLENPEKERTCDYAPMLLNGIPLSEDMYRIACNPTLAGIGPYRSIVGDWLWIKANAALVRREGSENTVKRIVSLYHEAFPALDLPDADFFIGEDDDPASALRSLLGELRAIFDEDVHPMKVLIQ
jgi:hypothetical protein